MTALAAFWKKYRLPILLLGLGLALYFDRQTTVELSENEFGQARQIAEYITLVALAGPWIVGSLLLSLFARTLHIRRWALHMFLALVSTGIVVLVLKILVGRARPGTWIPAGYAFQVSPFSWSPSYQSFPSGHTQTIFCVATLFSCLWPKKKATFFIVALAIALTRALVLKHFLSDIYAGMLIGIYGSYLSIKLWSQWVEAPKNA